MEKEGGLEEQADSRGRRGTETEDRWSNDSVYLLPLRRGKKRDGGTRGAKGQGEGRRETTRNEARKMVCAGAHLLLGAVIGEKER